MEFRPRELDYGISTAETFRIRRTLADLSGDAINTSDWNFALKARLPDDSIVSGTVSDDDGVLTIMLSAVGLVGETYAELLTDYSITGVVICIERYNLTVIESAGGFL